MFLTSGIIIVHFSCTWLLENGVRICKHDAWKKKKTMLESILKRETIFEHSDQSVNCQKYECPKLGM